MKKILSTALVLSLAAGMLTGCGGGKSDDTNTLKISGLNGGYGTKGWEAVVKAFEKKKGLKLN